MPGKFDALTTMEKGVLQDFNFLLDIEQTGNTLMNKYKLLYIPFSR